VLSLDVALALDRMLRDDPSADRQAVDAFFSEVQTLAEPQRERDVFNLQGSAETYDLLVRAVATAVDTSGSDVAKLTEELLSLIRDYNSSSHGTRQRAIKDLKHFCLSVHRESLDREMTHVDQQDEYLGNGAWP
jgi:hypothetical protein